MLMLNLKRKLGSRLVKQGDRTMLMLNAAGFKAEFYQKDVWDRTMLMLNQKIVIAVAMHGEIMETVQC